MRSSGARQVHVYGLTREELEIGANFGITEYHCHFCSKVYPVSLSYTLFSFFHFSTNILSSGLEVIKLFSCSTQLSMKFSLLINMKMPTIVGIFIFISRENFNLSYV